MHLNESLLLSVAIVALCIALWDLIDIVIDDKEGSEKNNQHSDTRQLQNDNDLVSKIEVQTTDTLTKMSIGTRIKKIGIFFGLIFGTLSLVPLWILRGFRALVTWIVPILVTFSMYLYYATKHDLYLMIAQKYYGLDEKVIQESIQNLIETFDLLSLSLVIFGLVYRDRKKKGKPIIAVFG
jgi:hypothetical protein